MPFDKFDPVFSNKFGFASCNYETGELHMGFRNFFLIFYSFNFSAFIKEMEFNLNDRKKDNYPSDYRNIIIPTPAREVSLLLSLDELESLVLFAKAVEEALLLKSSIKKTLRYNTLSHPN